VGEKPVEKRGHVQQRRGERGFLLRSFVDSFEERLHGIVSGEIAR